ncbi:nucleotide sugar dehydrogenase [Candidatus Merdisoma sp. JLR.KK006]|uniref:nucleotide sugar dehydrogenase n=1 Tax=Candidatus Merdisoma sp. JLR.KK006 TaxID=3112626 RepID=UPI002FF0B3EA
MKKFDVLKSQKDEKDSSFCDRLINRAESLALVGLGYVGMPIAVAFAKKGLNVIGFDNNQEKIAIYQEGKDPTNEVGDIAIKETTMEFTSDEKRLSDAKFIIVAVPTPVNMDHTPNLSPVEGASRIIGRNLTKGTIIVYESTVYPGVTEDVCIPILEQESGLKCGTDFRVGYSPERINPGDKVHTLPYIRKIVSGMDEESLVVIKDVYDLIIEAGTFPVSSIKTAEAIKVVENSQRDINIAFMNELAMVFDRMGIDTNEVVDGMNTKWNALGFRPGLVGGHCIGVDPYYFTYEAEKLGYHSQIILNGRIINDSMGIYVAEAAVKKMIEAGQAPKKSHVVILGLTFKENCPDTRNSKVNDIIRCLNNYGIKPDIVDPWASKLDAKKEYGVELTELSNVKGVDCVIVAVAHNEFRELSLAQIKKLFKYSADEEKVLIDVKGLYEIEELEKSGLKYWRL